MLSIYATALPSISFVAITANIYRESWIMGTAFLGIIPVLYYSLHSFSYRLFFSMFYVLVSYAIYLYWLLKKFSPSINSLWIVTAVGFLSIPESVNHFIEMKNTEFILSYQHFEWDIFNK